MSAAASRRLAYECVARILRPGQGIALSRCEGAGRAFERYCSLEWIEGERLHGVIVTKVGSRHVGRNEDGAGAGGQRQDAQVARKHRKTGRGRKRDGYTVV